MVYNFSFLADVKALRVVITGASSGIGEEISYQLAAMGAKLLVTARRESKLKNVWAFCIPFEII